MTGGMSGPSRRLWLILAPAIFLILWSAGFAVAKMGVEHAQPITLLAWRYGLVVTRLLPVALILRPAWPATARGGADSAIVGFPIQMVYFMLCYIAFKSGVSAAVTIPLALLTEETTVSRDVEFVAVLADLVLGNLLVAIGL